MIMLSGIRGFGLRRVRVSPVVVVDLAINIHVKAGVVQVAEVLHAVGQVAGAISPRFMRRLSSIFCTLASAKNFALAVLPMMRVSTLAKPPCSTASVQSPRLPRMSALVPPHLLSSVRVFFVGQAEVDGLVHALSHNGNGAGHDGLHRHPLPRGAWSRRSAWHTPP